MDAGVARPADIFGMYVFDKKAMKDRLPADIYKKLMLAIDGNEKLDMSIADYVASAMKDWALANGATHYAHWFQPRTEVTAERHLAFMTLDGEGHPINEFRGKELVISEPDASSFPSGGERSTFEARGYCAWDPSSPAFIVPSHKGGTLCVPSVFISYDGMPLDMKTPLLRSIDAIRGRAMTLLKLFGNRTVRSVDVTIGAEQEYFLVDASKAKKRPDIDLCRRTLIGAASPKPQTIEAHYFGSIPYRVIAFMEDVERDMYRLGQVLMTRHNEVAPAQFEFAPVLAEANLGCDQNQMLMEVMRKMARRHHFQLLLHEKPFGSINGSGKHLNFSLMDSEGRNLLKPTNNARRNIQFLSFICSFLVGVSKHGGVLRAAVASPGNAYRLGGHEAPPAIMSAYVGSLIDSTVSNIANGVAQDMSGKNLLDLGLSRLPTLNADASDRNRTSPIAFTGNKWEFRAVGAPQSLGAPLAAVLAVWCEGLDWFTAELKKRIADGADVSDAALAVIKDAWEISSNIRFEGNGYTDEWVEEAKRRGLPICKTTVEALDQYITPESKELFAKMGIMSERELVSFYTDRVEQFVETIETEAGVLRNMLYEGVLPAISKQLAREEKALAGMPADLGVATEPWKKSIAKLVSLKCGILEKIEKLDEYMAEIPGKESHDAAVILNDKVMVVMDEIRELADTAEKLVAKEVWPYPTYTELLRIDDYAE